jgi:DNA-binding NarL/FixJ family response regulator
MNTPFTTATETGNVPDAHPSNRALPTTGRGILVAVESARTRLEIADSLEELEKPLVCLADGYRLMEHLANALLGDDHQALHPGLIVMDAALPGCSGLALLAGLNALKWDVPVILLVKKEDRAILEQAWKLGETGIFVSPLNLGDLVTFSGLVLDPLPGHVVRPRPDSAADLDA